tara:strand:+ start:42841 stop:43038 length:198 start_codon:yes stop_codon:yes gene_type:complete
MKVILVALLTTMVKTALAEKSSYDCGTNNKLYHDIANGQEIRICEKINFYFEENDFYNLNERADT